MFFRNKLFLQNQPAGDVTRIIKNGINIVIAFIVFIVFVANVWIAPRSQAAALACEAGAELGPLDIPPGVVGLPPPVPACLAVPALPLLVPPAFLWLEAGTPAIRTVRHNCIWADVWGRCSAFNQQLCGGGRGNQICTASFVSPALCALRPCMRNLTMWIFV